MSSKHLSEVEAHTGSPEGRGATENKGTAMTCTSCGHAGLVESHISTAFRAGDEWAVIRDIPAIVCPTCREEFIDDATAVRLDIMRANGFASQEPSETMTVPVFTFRADRGRHS